MPCGQSPGIERLALVECFADGRRDKDVPNAFRPIALQSGRLVVLTEQHFCGRPANGPQGGSHKCQRLEPVRAANRYDGGNRWNTGLRLEGKRVFAGDML